MLANAHRPGVRPAPYKAYERTRRPSRQLRLRRRRSASGLQSFLPGAGTMATVGICCIFQPDTQEGGRYRSRLPRRSSDEQAARRYRRESDVAASASYPSLADADFGRRDRIDGHRPISAFSQARSCGTTRSRLAETERRSGRRHCDGVNGRAGISLARGLSSYAAQRKSSTI